MKNKTQILKDLKLAESNELKSTIEANKQEYINNLKNVTKDLSFIGCNFLVI